MKKLMLQLDALRVESFDTGADGGSRGTVRGHDTRETEFCTMYAGCTIKNCQTNETCYVSCPNLCDTEPDLC